MPRIGIGLGVGTQRASGGGGFVGLLDLYPSASVAYSLRKLSSTYTGNAIRVRRASDNTEQNIGFDALGNLDTTALTTFCSGTNGFVTTWYDQSGNGANATQTTASFQPQIVNAGSVILQNSKPTIDFYTSGVFFNLTQTNYKTAFSVAKINTVSTINYICFNTLSVPANGLFYGGTFSGVDGLGFVQGSNVYSQTGEDLNRHLGYFNNTDTQLQVGKDGQSITSFTLTANLSLQTISRALTSTSFLGNMQELIFYPTSKSSNRVGIESNINSNYGIY